MERNTRIEEELFPFYALDALTEEERVEVERYVSANPDASLRLAELTAAALDFSAATPPMAPSPHIKAGLMARVAAETQEAVPAPLPPRKSPTRAPTARPRRWWPILTPALGAFAALALILSAFAIWRLSGQVNELTGQVAALEQNTDALQTEMGTLEVENETLRRELSARDDMLALYTQPGAVTIAIGDVTGEHPSAHGTLTLDPATETATLRVDNLPPSEAGTTYQAWLIVDETPVSVGTFTIDESGTRTHTITESLPASFDALGISLEPEGGSETPTPGNILLLGNSF